MTPFDLAKIDEARGVREYPGKANSEDVMAYYDDAGHSWVKDDETPWCAAAMSAWIKRAGHESPGTLRARDFDTYGHPVKPPEAKKGDICVFSRGKNPAFGHVAFFVRWNNGNPIVLGGNQGDAVSFKEYPRDRLISIRRGPWNEEKPKGIASIIAALLNLLKGLKR